MTYLLIAVATACSLSLSNPFSPSEGGERVTALSQVGEVYGQNLSEARADALMIIPGIKIEFHWKGSGFLCLEKGTSCDITIGGSLSVQAPPETYGFPAGSSVGFIDMVDNEPIDEPTPLHLGERNVESDDVRVLEGNPLPPGTTIYIPSQETVFDPAGGHMFYYYGG